MEVAVRQFERRSFQQSQMHAKTICLVAALFLLCSVDATGQEPVDTVFVLHFSNDTVDFQVEVLPDTINHRYNAPDIEDADIVIFSDTSEFVNLFPLEDLDSYSKHSPAKAAMMSAVVPGLGQIYNGKYWKVPIVYAAVGVSVGIFLKWQNEFSRYRRAYIDINDENPYTNFHLTIGFPSSYTDEMMKQHINKRKDDLRTWRDWSIVAMVATYALNIIDANVDAHLMDFNLDDNISLNIRPYFFRNCFDSQKIGLSLCLEF